MVVELDRFLSKVVLVESGCHEWQSTIKKDGYGQFWFRGVPAKAHRVSYMLQVGEIPEGLMVLHKCDNRKCVNPDHLYLGTAKDNIRDRNERCPWFGRMKTPFAAIQEIRKLYATGEFSQQFLADRFGVHQTQVSRYVLGQQRLAR